MSSQERKKVEDAYVQGLRRLARREQPSGDSELGYADLMNIRIPGPNLTDSQYLRVAVAENRSSCARPSRVARRIRVTNRKRHHPILKAV